MHGAGVKCGRDLEEKSIIKRRREGEITILFSYHRQWRHVLTLLMIIAHCFCTLSVYVCARREACAENLGAVDNELLINFWEHFTSAKYDGQFLQFTGTIFLGQPAFGDKLYVRQEYRELSSLLDALHANEASVAVIGTPGKKGF